MIENYSYKFDQLNQIIIQLISPLEYVDLFCMHGSQVVGTARINSDIDYYTLLISKHYRDNLLNELGKRLPPYGEKDSYFSWEGRRVSIHFFETKQFIKNLKLMSQNLKNFQQYQGYAQGYIYEAMPILDKNNIFQKLEAITAPDSPKIQKLLKEAYQYNLTKLNDNINGLKRGISNPFYFIHKLNDINEFILRSLYAANNHYYLSNYKRIHKDLFLLQPNISEELNFIVIESNIPSNIEKKIELLNVILKKLTCHKINLCIEAL